MRTKKSNPAAQPLPSPSIEAPTGLDQAKAILATSPTRTKIAPVRAARLARLALLLVLRLRLEPYQSRLGQLPGFLFRPGALEELEVLARALLALPRAARPRDPDRARRARDRFESAAALRGRLRRALPRCFDAEDEVHAELLGLGRPGKRPLLDDLQRLDTALGARRAAWTPYPQFLDPADFEAIGPTVAALEAELGVTVDPLAELEPQLRAQITARFRRARAIGLLVLEDGETAPPLPKLVVRKKKAKKKDGEGADDAKSGAEAGKKGKGGDAKAGSDAKADPKAAAKADAKAAAKAARGAASRTPSSPAKASPSKPAEGAAAASPAGDEAPPKGRKPPEPVSADED